MVVQVHISTANLRAYVRITGINKEDTLFVMRGIQTIWEVNIERFFSKHKVSYPIPDKKNRKYAPIKEAFYCSVLNGEIIGTIDAGVSPHIKHLIFGVPPGKGKFVPSMGVRTKEGHFWGVPTIYWKTWESYFKKEVWALVGEYTDTHRGGRKHADIGAIRAAAVAKVRRQVSSMKGGLL